MPWLPRLAALAPSLLLAGGGGGKAAAKLLAAAAGRALAVGFLPADAGHRGIALHRSGTFWLPVPLPGATGQLSAIAAIGGQYARAAGQGPGGSASILATRDDRSSWTQQAPPGSFALDAVAFAGASAGWAGGAGGVLATVDGGAAH